MTTRNERPQRNGVRWVLVALVILTACTTATLGITTLGDRVTQARSLSPVDVARQQAELERIQLASRVGKTVYVVVVSAGVLGGVVLFGFAVLSAGLWMWRRAATVRPDERGLMPMFHAVAIRLKLFSRWLEVRSLIVDPNRSPTAVIEVGTDTVSGIAFIAPDQVSAAQMQATMGAQLVQATAAEASGARVTAPGRTTRGRTALRGQPEIVIYQREQSPIARLPIPDSHVERLLVEQGQLVPQEIGEQGQASI